MGSKGPMREGNYCLRFMDLIKYLCLPPLEQCIAGSESAGTSGLELLTFSHYDLGVLPDVAENRNIVKLLGANLVMPNN